MPRMSSLVPLYNTVRTPGSPSPGDTKGAVLLWIVLSRSDLQYQELCAASPLSQEIVHLPVSMSR